MTNGPNRVVDEFAKLMTDAAGVAQGFKKEAETVFRVQAEKFIGDMDLVHREEFDAVKDIAVEALDEVKKLRAELDALKPTKKSK
jgi:BMFP domain-containing protein YqiC